MRRSVGGNGQKERKEGRRGRERGRGNIETTVCRVQDRGTKRRARQRRELAIVAEENKTARYKGEIKEYGLFFSGGRRETRSRNERTRERERKRKVHSSLIKRRKSREEGEEEARKYGRNCWERKRKRAGKQERERRGETKCGSKRSREGTRGRVKERERERGACSP